MSNNNNVNTASFDRYSGGAWSKLLQQAQAIREEYERGGHSEADKHRFADRLREIFGGFQAAEVLIPRIRNEHRRGVEWALERLLVAYATLETMPYVEATERDSVQLRINGVIQRIDQGDLDDAESEVRALERRLSELQMQSLDTEVASLLSGIGTAYAATLQ
jgi:hypothetical protein